MLKDAQERKYCVGYFESWDLESTMAVVHAAEKLRSPVIIGYCGEYLENPERAYREDLHLHGKMLRHIARSASVPVATLLNECSSAAYAMNGISARFDMVMFVDEEMPHDTFVAEQRKLVEFAHACGVAVEGELGTLPTANKNSGTLHGGRYTDPDKAAHFVRETGVDVLSIAIGNTHLLEDGKAELDIDLLERIHNKVNIPLALHGGTGVEKAVFKEASRHGIAKVNVGAGLKRAAINAFRAYFQQMDVNSMNPNRILGDGGSSDFHRRAHDAVMKTVAEFIQAFGGENKARIC